MPREYVEERNGGRPVTGTRVSLDFIVYALLRDDAAEGSGESLRALNLEQIFGALAFCLANRGSILHYLAAGEKGFELFRQRAQRRDPAFYARMPAERKIITPPGAP